MDPSFCIDRLLLSALPIVPLPSTLFCHPRPSDPLGYSAPFPSPFGPFYSSASYFRSALYNIKTHTFLFLFGPWHWKLYTGYLWNIFGTGEHSDSDIIADQEVKSMKQRNEDIMIFFRLSRILVCLWLFSIY